MVFHEDLETVFTVKGIHEEDAWVLRDDGRTQIVRASDLVPYVAPTAPPSVVMAAE